MLRIIEGRVWDRKVLLLPYSPDSYVFFGVVRPDMTPHLRRILSNVLFRGGSDAAKSPAFNSALEMPALVPKLMIVGAMYGSGKLTSPR